MDHGVYLDDFAVGGGEGRAQGMASLLDELGNALDTLHSQRAPARADSVWALKAILSPEFRLTSLVVVLVPGTGVVYTTGMGIAHGWRAGLIAAVGFTLGIVPHILAAVQGLSVLLNASAVAIAGLAAQLARQRA